MSDKEHADRIMKLLADTAEAISEAKRAGLTVDAQFVHLTVGSMVSFQATIQRITLIDSAP